MEAISSVRRSLLAVACVVAAAIVWAPSARAGVDCTFEADPPNLQFRGAQITVTGSFTELPPNHDFYVIMATDMGAFGPEGQVLQPVGTTNGAGDFDHTVTIPSDHPTGNFDLTVAASEAGLGFPTLHVCSIPYTVSQLFVGTVVLPTTTTTFGIALPTTSTPPSTTTLPPAPTTTAEAMTTTTEPAAATTTTTTTTTTSESTSTTGVDDTTTTGAESEALVDSEQTGGGGAPGWMIALLIAMALALAAIGGYALARRRTGGA